MIECSICKSSSQDGSVYCSECGQRLQQAGNSASKLHSPLLDASIYEQKPPSQTDSTPQPGSSAHNGLHSPILDAWSTQPLEENLSDPRSKSKQGPQLIAELSAGLSAAQSARSDSGQTNKPTRLHSPVLDGPGQTNQAFEPEDLDLPVEEYNSLRSPLLGAKVPLLNQSPLETGDRPPVRSPIQTGHFSKITGLKKEDIVDRQTLLPKNEELKPEQLTASEKQGSGLFKAFATALVVLVISVKFWYWQSLGSVLFSSQPFLLDQIGGVLIILLLLILILTAKI